MDKLDEREYVILNLHKEYPGYQDDCHYAVVTDLSPDEFQTKHGELLRTLSKVVYLTKDQLRAFNEYDRNEAKHRMRRIRRHVMDGYNEGETEIIYSLESKDNLDDLMIRNEKSILIQKAMNKLSEVQKRRLLLYYYYGLSCCEIASLEGVSRSSVGDSIRGSITKMAKQKYLYR